MENNWPGKNSFFKDMDKDAILANMDPMAKPRGKAHM